ncbi:MAG: maleylpyruvate isomerase N-terminal domain-containing protein [Bacteroidota bacterium]
MSAQSNIPIDVVHLLPVLDEKLMVLLKSLAPEDWQKQTIAKLWTVKDVAAHLLDGNIRILSMLRDDYHGESPDIHSYQDLLDYLNGLNADWVKAMKRVSPTMLLLLHEATGKAYCDYYASLDPFGKAGFAVNWAGEEESKNWMHIAREYTEKWLHQQQIRDAVNQPGLMAKELFYPFIDIFMQALPYTFREVAAEDQTSIQIIITGDIGGSWYLTRKENKWVLGKENIAKPSTVVSIGPDIAWRLFSKSIRPEQVKDSIQITGNRELGEKVLSMVSVMA